MGKRKNFIDIYESDFGAHVILKSKPKLKDSNCLSIKMFDFYPIKWVVKKYKAKMAEYLLNKKLKEVFDSGVRVDSIYDEVGVFKMCGRKISGFCGSDKDNHGLTLKKKGGCKKIISGRINKKGA